MATLSTIPTQPGTEVIRVLLTLSAGAGSDITDVRSSRDNCTLTGDAVFNGQLSLDGINPLGNQGNEIRLRRSGSIGFNSWPSHASVRLKFASSADADAVLDGSLIAVGGGYWNWRFTSPVSSQSGGGTINLVMWLPPATRDVSGDVAAGAPSVTATAEKVATSTPQTHDVSADVSTGAPALTASVERVPAGDVESGASVSAGAPDVSVDAETVAVGPPSDTDAAVGAGAPALTAEAEVVGPGRTVAIQRILFLESMWIPRTNPLRATMRISVDVEGATEDLCGALCRELARRLPYYTYGEDLVPVDSAPSGTLTASSAVNVKGGLVVSVDTSQTLPEYVESNPEPDVSEARLILEQGTTSDFDDRELFISRRLDLRRVLARLNGDIGA